MTTIRKPVADIARQPKAAPSLPMHRKRPPGKPCEFCQKVRNAVRALFRRRA